MTTVLNAPIARAAALLLVCACPAAAQLVNPDFDAGSTGWSLYLGTNATPTWDGSVGSPTPGSAVVSSPAAPPGWQYPGFSQCFAAAPGDVLTASARVEASLRAGDACQVELFFFPCAACGCASADSGFDATVSATDGWDTVSDSETAPAGTVSASVHLLMKNVSPPTGRAEAAGDVASTCRFDSARLYAGEVVLADDFEISPIEAWSAVAPADCSGSCLGGSPVGCWCDADCVSAGDCCPDACLTCGSCP